MPRAPYYQWEGIEYPFEEKGADWYWALGIIAAAGIIAAILFSNFILALVIAAAAAAAGLQAAKRPEVRRFAITDQGLVVDNRLHPYEEMLSFSVLEYADPALPPSLSIKTKRMLAPHLLIPINGYDPIEIYEHFLQVIPEGKHDESVLDRLVEFLRI
jgi:hypothetical protein